MQYKVPTKEEIFNGVALANTHDPYLALCLMQPNPAWIKQHPIIKVKNEMGQKVPLQYLPVDKVEYLLSAIWGKWRREIVSVQQIFNSVQVTVRLHYYHPGHDVWYWTDGVGAVGVQTDKDATAANLEAIKSNAVQIATPAAAQYALKDAAEELGPIFGRDLNKGGTFEIEAFNPAALQNPALAGSVPVNQPAHIGAPQPVYAQAIHTIQGAQPMHNTVPANNIPSPAPQQSGSINW